MIILLILSFTLNNNINVLGDTIFNDYIKWIIGLVTYSVRSTL